jgi:hypothetical protein
MPAKTNEFAKKGSRMIPVNLTETIHASLREDRREPDGLLHASGDLVGSLRHSMLRAAGAPTLESEIVSDVRLMTGTFWHRYVGSVLVEQGIPFMQEVKLSPWLPEGWSGTADWLFWDAEREAFVLGDLKTTKGEAVKWLRTEGIKLEHIWQLSAYYYACLEMGLPMLRGVSVFYLPMNNTQDKQEQIEPILLECDPLPRDEVWAEMESRWAATKKYLASLNILEPGVAAWYDSEYLAPEQDRVQKIWWNKSKGVFDVKLVRHWSADFCPYPNELCACSEASQEKIGEWKFLEGDGLPDWPDAWVYQERKGYEGIEPLVEPTEKEKKKREKELNA